MPDIYTILYTIILYLISYFNISFLFEHKKKPNLIIFTFGLFLFFLTIWLSSPLKIIIQLLILIIISTISYKNLKKSIEATIFQFWILLIVEIIITLLLVILNIEITQNIQYLCNILIPIVTHLFLKQRIIHKLWEIIQEKKYIPLIFPFILIIYLNMGTKQNIITVPIISLLLLIYLYLLLKEKLENKFLTQQIDTLMDFILTYEKGIEDQRIRNHEFKNSLLYIRALAQKNKQVTDYIDEIIGTNKPQNYELLKNVQKLQISPLKGFIYYKLMECKNKDIKITLNISSDISTSKIKKITAPTIQKIIQILGILIDNAMDACLETESKSLSIYIYEEKDQLIFQISNTFKGTIHINLLFKKGYSTKGRGRGYGLHLVQSILKENPDLSLETEIHDDIFIQTLKRNLN